MARHFPEGFVFGSSTAAYQIEGATKKDGRGESVWDRFSATPGKVARGETGEHACDHYHRWEEDLDLAAGAGMTVYRFSLAWPRLFPQGTGPRNDAGFDFYRRLIEGCHARGIEPWPCLYHWDLPQALMDRGGWTNRDSASWFADYAAAAARALGGDVPAIVLFNEPSVFTVMGYLRGHHAPGLSGLSNFAPAMHHVNLAQGLGAEAVRSETKARLGTVLAWADFVPNSDSEEDARATRWIDEHNNTGFADPLFFGTYPDLVTDTLSDHIREGDLTAMRTDFDFIGLNYYIHGRCSVDADGRPVMLQPDPSLGLSEMGWESRPDSLTACLARFAKLYGDVPLWVTENGMAAPDRTRGPDGRIVDRDRIAYLRDHLAAVIDSVEAGVDVRGYLVWTLLDNFEWAEGYRPRFGLVETDYDGFVRRPKASYDWYGEVARSGVLPDPA